MIKVKWDIEEAVMLVDLYYLNIDASRDDLKVNAETLSCLLKKRAVILGIDNDDKFRNIEGILMKYENLRYLDTNGSEGLSSYSKIDKAALLLRKTKPLEFNKIIEQFYSKYVNHPVE